MRSRFIDVEGRVLVLSVSREKCFEAQLLPARVLGLCCICRAREDTGVGVACSGASRDTGVICRDKG